MLKRTIYPLIVREKLKKDSLKHVTNQDLCFLFKFMDLHPSVVTCYDLIPVAFYRNNSIYWKMNLKGLKKADHIITISEFSKNDIIRLTGVPEEMISIVYPGVDTSRYFPKPSQEILRQYHILNTDFVILYVGSEEPRKNIGVLIEALHSLKKAIPNIKLLKVGGPQMGGDRGSLLALIQSLHLENDIIFTGQVTEADLPLYYNAAELLILPSRYEGFGLPPLEAMACGCPVLCANTTSLPEVTGNCPSILFDPDNKEILADKMADMLTDEMLRESAIRNGLKRSKMFSWDDAARKTEEIYSNLMNKH
jgi:glycosyltransferase involved in cell wall biosynthesis